MRAAQSIGLHRDGKHFKLSPLECELRRRVWWLLFATDARMSEDHGITIISQDAFGDAEIPTNIDDIDISEAKTEPVPSQPRWTEMTFSLIVIHINRVWTVLTQPKPNSDKPEKILEELNVTITEAFMQYCDPDIPIQRMGLVLWRVLKCKLEVQIRQKALLSQPNSSMNQEAAQELLGIAVRGLDFDLQMSNDELLRGYRWLTSTHTQYHLLTYILWHLCLSPTGPHVEDAWRGINIHFDIAEKDPMAPDPGPKWPMLVQLRAKALRVRAAHFAAIREQPPSVFADATLEEAVQQAPETELLDIDSWDFTLFEFPDIWHFMANGAPAVG